MLGLVGFSQCNYTGTPLTQVGTTNTFCIDNTTTITTASVRAGQYVVVNVVKGFNYTFSIGNAFFLENENLTILNASTNASVGAFASSFSGASVTWTASLSGSIKVLVSKGNCVNDNTAGGALTLKLNSIGNTQDSQTAYGVNQWIGHVYNWTGSAPPGGTSPTTISATTPFVNANYAGNYTINSETIAETFGGNAACFPVNSNGVNLTNIYTEQYAVRYRMKSTKVGCYMATFSGDDGIRVYVDGVRIFDEWKEQGVTAYGNVMLYLSGNSEIVFDYYENGGGNVVNFSLAPFDPSSNSISSAVTSVNSGSAPGIITGTNYVYSGTVVNPTISYQWQSSTNGVTFTNIAGATSKDYTPLAITTPTTVATSYRRLVTASAASQSCVYISNVVVINTVAFEPCSYSNTMTQAGTVNTFCIDNSNTIYSPTVNAGQYLLVDVVKGFTYTFSVGNIFYSDVETLTGINAATNLNIGSTAFSYGLNGTSLTWTATLSGQIKLLLSKGGCVNDNSAGGMITLVLNSIGNTQDSQLAFGNDNWVGHVYNWTGTSPAATNPTTPASVAPFIDANYAGYYTISTETIAENFTGDYVCFPVYSNGAIRTSIYTQQYAVRYRMHSTKTGCYMANFSGDDGVRVFVNGVKVFDEWKEQSPTSYGNVLLYLDGNSDIVFDYFENGGNNVVNFSLTPFVIDSNALVATNTAVCSGNSPGLINGTSYVYNGNTTNPSISFQWQISTNNSTFTNISGATTEDYTPAAITASGTNAVRYYRRIVSAVGTNANSCFSTSNVITITTSPTGNPATPGVISGIATQCPSATSQTYSVANVTNATSYAWTVPTGWTITSGNTTNTITVTVGTTGQNGSITVRATNGCGTGGTRTLAVTVTTLPVVGTVSANQTICAGALPASITLSGNTGTIQWQSSLDNGTFSNITGATTATLAAATIGNLSVTKYFRAVVTGGCTSLNSNVVKITVTPTAIGGTVSNNQTICSSKLPDDLVLSGNVGAVVKWQKATNSSFTLPVDIGNNTTVLSGESIGFLNVTTYFRAVIQSGSCSNATSSYVTITVGGTSIWNGTSWNVEPTGYSSLVFNDNFNSTTSISGCSCTVNSGNVVINSGHNMTVGGSVAVNGGTLTFESNANLVQTTNAQNTGAISIKRKTEPLMRLDYVLWSAPVVGQQLQSFSAGTIANRFYTYNPSTNLYEVVASPSATNFTTGKGYLIRMSNWHPATPTIWQGTFTGVPNNGTVTIPVTNGTYNAIGNPYPSTIDADAFIAQNNITEAIYLWRKTNNDANTSYATYTLAGGTRTKSNVGDPLNLVPNGTIQVGQGFIVKATSSTISFTNSMRVADNGNQFFRTASNNKSRIWLNLTNATGLFSQTMIAYMPTATLGIDTAIDGHYYNDSQTALTSIINGEEFSVQGRPTFNASDVVSLGFKAQTAGEFAISIDNIDGLFTEGQEIFLKDNLTNTIHNLSNGSYSFASEVGTFNTRFEIIYQSTLATQTQVLDANNVIVYKQDQNIVVNTGKVKMNKVRVFDINGRLLLEEKNINASTTKVSTKATNQVVIVQITTIDDVVISKKVIN